MIKTLWQSWACVRLYIHLVLRDFHIIRCQVGNIHFLVVIMTMFSVIYKSGTYNYDYSNMTWEVWENWLIYITPVSVMSVLISLLLPFFILFPIADHRGTGTRKRSSWLWWVKGERDYTHRFCHTISGWIGPTLFCFIRGHLTLHMFNNVYMFAPFSVLIIETRTKACFPFTENIH